MLMFTPTIYPLCNIGSSSTADSLDTSQDDCPASGTNPHNTASVPHTTQAVLQTKSNTHQDPLRHCVAPHCSPWSVTSKSIAHDQNLLSISTASTARRAGRSICSVPWYAVPWIRSWSTTVSYHSDVVA